jgi:hypothetical protein
MVFARASNIKLVQIFKFVDKSFFEELILSIQIPAPLAFRLTVAREQFPMIYKHSLLLMVIGIYLAHCDKMAGREQRDVCIAALFHDIGLLHIDPMLLAPSYVMSHSERRHLYTHPLTAHLLLSEFPIIPRQIADAVLEHHERMDGSGYPRNLHGDKISRYGQILAVGELAAKAFDFDHPRIPWKKMEVLFKLNSRKYGQGLIGHLNIFRENNIDEASSINITPSDVINQANLISKFFEDFNHRLAPTPHDKISQLALTRMDTLRLELFEAGFDPRDPTGTIERFVADPESLIDFEIVLNAALWQFKSLVLEISQRWPDAIKEDYPSKISEHAWLDNLQQSLHTADIHI